jgi:hypothetical protein
MKKKTKKRYYVLLGNDDEIRIMDSRQLKIYFRQNKNRVKKPDIRWKMKNSVFVI